MLISHLLSFLVLFAVTSTSYGLEYKTLRSQISALISQISDLSDWSAV